MTTATPFHGLVPPVVTPLGEDLTVDVASLERLVARMIDAGVDGLFALGSSGETVLLDDAQRDLALEVIVKTADGRVPVIAGAIEPGTARSVQRARAAERLGAQAVVATAPFYVIVGPHEIERHFRSVAAAVDVPLFAYDIPVCVHSKLSNDLVLRLAHDGVIAGVKDSSGDDVGFRQLLVQVAAEGLSDFATLTGHEVMVDSMLLAGASGSVPGLANVDPAGYARLHAAVAAGDVAAARAEQERLIQLFRIVDAADPATSAGMTRGAGSFKTALHVLGVIDSNAISLPLRALDDAESGRVREVLESVGLL
ncbi:dihydrodipicolinate synthase family protein [Intrasporangium calvum]|uniref:Dihydrodipicolinate synthetase n=1 Tax=Intrasporangium calvum (strain ATCC 23552 / DSM 43043 / JCM 3097 / NBRC 12989 / NCIMB 10167 / NRRL B-3866 / 7 KIP) TaxID=710696 RepID=E6SCS0_INTC7|nr:dihydrodipicolinate synthase family protein [Intrasporangium calvum]ADU47475.1 dihydrodipicolinate synthetase [Intrasporangium calvum DSM 43043]